MRKSALYVAERLADPSDSLAFALELEPDLLEECKKREFGRFSREILENAPSYEFLFKSLASLPVAPIEEPRKVSLPSLKTAAPTEREGVFSEFLISPIRQSIDVVNERGKKNSLHFSREILLVEESGKVAKFYDFLKFRFILRDSLILIRSQSFVVDRFYCGPLAPASFIPSEKERLKAVLFERDVAERISNAKASWEESKNLAPIRQQLGRLLFQGKYQSASELVVSSGEFFEQERDQILRKSSQDRRFLQMPLEDQLKVALQLGSKDKIRRLFLADQLLSLSRGINELVVSDQQFLEKCTRETLDRISKVRSTFESLFSSQNFSHLFTWIERSLQDALLRVFRFSIESGDLQEVKKFVAQLQSVGLLAFAFGYVEDCIEKLRDRFVATFRNDFAAAKDFIANAGELAAASLTTIDLCVFVEQLLNRHAKFVALCKPEFDEIEEHLSVQRNILSLVAFDINDIPALDDDPFYDRFLHNQLLSPFNYGSNDQFSAKNLAVCSPSIVALVSLELPRLKSVLLVLLSSISSEKFGRKGIFQYIRDLVYLQKAFAVDTAALILERRQLLQRFLNTTEDIDLAFIMSSISSN